MKNYNNVLIISLFLLFNFFVFISYSYSLFLSIIILISIIIYMALNFVVFKFSLFFPNFIQIHFLWISLKVLNKVYLKNAKYCKI